jgi:hypothetical protein
MIIGAGRRTVTVERIGLCDLDAAASHFCAPLARGAPLGEGWTMSQIFFRFWVC